MQDYLFPMEPTMVPYWVPDVIGRPDRCCASILLFSLPKCCYLPCRPQRSCSPGYMLVWNPPGLVRKMGPFLPRLTGDSLECYLLTSPRSRGPPVQINRSQACILLYMRAPHTSLTGMYCTIRWHIPLADMHLSFNLSCQAFHQCQAYILPYLDKVDYILVA